jgi:hypothetical protein
LAPVHRERGNPRARDHREREEARADDVAQRLKTADALADALEPSVGSDSFEWKDAQVGHVAVVE